MHLTPEEIARATHGRLIGSGPAGPIRTDTRELEAGSWFVALRGPRFDAHDFLDAAQAEGAVGCIVDRTPSSTWSGAIVLVTDTTVALQDLGRHARERLTGPVIALTGSSGKTTTRSLCALALSPLGEIHQTAGNLNNHLGVPLTLLAASESAAAHVLELGTSSPGEIAVLADICVPDVRLVINVGPAHLEELGGLEGVAREKTTLFRTARQSDVLCINLDDPWLRTAEGDGKRITWGRHEEAEIRLVHATVNPKTMETHAKWDTSVGSVESCIPAPGEHFALDATAALAVAEAVGVDLHAAAASFANYQPVGMRLRREVLAHDVVALNDSYNANPASTVASLRVLGGMPGRRIAVLGDLLELGPEEDRWHREVVEFALELRLNLLVLAGPRMARAAEESSTVWAEPHPDPEQVGARLGAWVTDGDHILFKGSRGARVERILDALRSSLSARKGTGGRP